MRGLPAERVTFDVREYRTITVVLKPARQTFLDFGSVVFQRRLFSGGASSAAAMQAAAAEPQPDRWDCNVT